MKTPPYRIETDRLVIRCWEPRDAPLLKEAVESSLDHLSPWMPWAPPKPEPLEIVVDRLRGFRGGFDRDEDWIYGIFDADESRVVGGTGLHSRVGPGGLEIGYFVRADAIRRGYATEVAAALTRIGIELCGADRIEIRIDPRNAASLPIPRKLGFREEATLRRRLPSGEGKPLRDLTVFSLLAEELAASPAATASYRGFDAAGRLLV